MKFYCSQCRVTFSVSDEKIPDSKGLKVLCPRCRTPVERMDETGVSEGGEPEELSVIPPAGDLGRHQDSSDLEVLEEGAKAALLYVSRADRLERLRDVLAQLDYYVSIASNATTAINRLEQNPYQLVILDEAVQENKENEILVLHHVQLLPMHVRRQFFLCLLSENLPTLDRLASFRLGVDLIINLQDLEKTKLILVRALKDQKSFYKAFSSELERKL